MKITGGCYCKEIRYQIDGDMETAFQCHCRECQYITGGNPNAAVVFSQNDFKYINGTPSKFVRPDIQMPVHRYFCANCGTAIGSTSPARPGSIIIKVGTLDEQNVFKPKAAIFTCDRQTYHHIPDELPSYEKRPQKINPSQKS